MNWEKHRYPKNGTAKTIGAREFFVAEMPV